MAGATSYLQNALLQHVLGIEAYAQPADLYVGLSRTDPLADGSGLTEPAGGGYARVNAVAAWQILAEGQANNSGALAFPAATADQSTVAYWTLWDAASGGNLLWYGPLAAPTSISSGNTPSFAIGALSLGMTAGL